MLILILVQLTVVVLNSFWLCLILVGLPGTWLMLATAAIVEWLTDARLFSTPVLVMSLVLGVIGELIEFFASMTGAKRAGATRRGALAALVGGISGAILGTMFIPVPVLGSLAGGGLGAFTGASLVEHGGGKELREALKIGTSAGTGHMLGIVGKLAMGVLVWILLAVAVIWP